ncbi:hypothetical protein FF1_023336 [Malus domestica]
MSTGILTGWPLQGQLKALQGHCICRGFQQFRVYGPLRPSSESLVSIIGDQRDDQNMLFDIVKESDDPTLPQPSSS